MIDIGKWAIGGSGLLGFTVFVIVIGVWKVMGLGMVMVCSFHISYYKHIIL